MTNPFDGKRAMDFFKALVLMSIIVTILGYVDYVTGEISIDILYLFCVFFVTWYTNGRMGLLCIVEIILAKITADYYDRVDVLSQIYDSNMFYTISVNAIVCVLVIQLKKALTK